MATVDNTLQVNSEDDQHAPSPAIKDDTQRPPNSTSASEFSISDEGPTKPIFQVVPRNRFLDAIGLNRKFRHNSIPARRVGCCWAHLTPRQKWPRRILACVLFFVFLILPAFFAFVYLAVPHMITEGFGKDAEHQNFLDRFQLLRVYNDTSDFGVGAFAIDVGFR